MHGSCGTLVEGDVLQLEEVRDDADWGRAPHGTVLWIFHCHNCSVGVGQLDYAHGHADEFVCRDDLLAVVALDAVKG